VRVETALLGAEVVLAPGASVVLPVPDGYEVGVLVDSGSVTFAGAGLAAAVLGVVDVAPGGSVGTGERPGAAGGSASGSGPVLTAGVEGARVLALGGEPFGEEVVMWWNFIGASHDEVVAAREAWEAGEGAGSGRFGAVEGYEGQTPRIPAPSLPGVRLRPRGNRGAHQPPVTEAPAMS
jgi:redox-sensitive bicupin YhaK (pirin superfamily)